jgi:hypothetical protein
MVLGCYCIVYLGPYIFLPNRWETPFNFDLFSIIKIVFNFPWVVFAALNPAVAIGGLGVFRLYDLDFLAIAFGVLVYLSLFLLLSLYWKEIRIILRSVSLTAKSFALVFLVNYVLVYSASDSLWIKDFPLFRLESPQFIWARWSAVIPLSFLLIIASVNSITPRTKCFFLFYVSIQWSILILAAYPWLQRYW